MDTHEQDIVVIGGGISGVAIAYGLAGQGRKVMVVDRPTPTNMATRSNVGLIWCQSKFLHLPNYARWGFMSSELFPGLHKELEEVSGLKIPALFEGGIIPVLSAEDYQRRGEYIEKLRATLGTYRGGMIDRTELEAKLPKIQWGKDVCGAAWCEDDGLIDPLALLNAFRVALPKVGVELRTGLVHAIEPKDGGYNIRTDSGVVSAERIVLAAGLGNRRLCQFALRELPVFPDLGQVLLVERMPFVMRYPVLGATQTFGGTTILGFRHENSGHRMSIDQKAVASEGFWAMRVWPELGRRRLIRAWTGLRVMPNDNMAIYSQLPGHPNAYLINTHSSITMAAAHTRLLPQFVLGGALPETAREMTLSRFGIVLQ